MSELLVIFAIAILLAGALTNIGIWSPRRVWVKICAVVVAALFLPVSYGAFAELLSRPKPMNMEWVQRAVPEAVVLASRQVEGEAIYLWLGLAGQSEPRAYALLWNEELAKQLHSAQQQASADGRNTMMRQPFDTDADKAERVFYAEPQPAAPAKQIEQGSGPVIFKGTGE